MSMSLNREKVRFASGGTECVAWHYPGTNGGCVVMAGGGGVTKEPGTDRFAKRFNAAGFAVLAFDYRRLGESGGQPRQVVRMRDQVDDWQAAIGFAATLPGVDPARLGVWGFSLSGGHVFPVAARNPQLAAAIAQTPNADGPVASRNASRHQKPLAMLKVTALTLLDMLGGLVGRKPLLIGLSGEPGETVMLATPDGRLGDQVLNPDNAYPRWQQEVAARSVLNFSLYKPGRHASRVRCPLLVVVADQDQSVLAAPAVRAAGQARDAELVHVPGGHYAPFQDAHESAVEAELDFLRRRLLGEGAGGHASRGAARPAPGRGI
ncbi:MULTISPECIES: alpha/beta hydrolase [unclassified Streptomyces]|uniref:alpha/beta hydrolase n=1 Tax=unclassified Streptomyces TaxID=2593676 RepID=UPI00099C8BF5|nr:alpha/beta hydrolase [Streptomyces sp. NBC_00370]